MERLDFASVMAVLRQNIPDENFENQTDFLHSLLIDVNMRPQYAIEFDQGQVCRWINGLARLSPNIISFYQEKDNQWKLVRRIKERVLPLMPDSAMAAQELFFPAQEPRKIYEKQEDFYENRPYEKTEDNRCVLQRKSPPLRRSTPTIRI